MAAKRFSYGRAVRILRNAAGWNQAQLAVKLDVHRSYVGMIESGRRRPSLGFLESVAATFRVPLYLVIVLASDRKTITNVRTKNTAEELLTKLLD